MEETIEPITQQLIRSLPKAEVHVHLEGSIDLPDLLELAEETGSPLPGPAATLFDTSTHTLPVAGSGLSAFLRFLDWEGSLFHTREQLARAAHRFAARQSASGVRYTDVIVNPTHWAAWSGRLDAFLDALRSGFDDAQSDGLCTVNICVSLDRGQSAAEAIELATWLVDRRPPRVVAISIDGDEQRSGRTGAVFAPAFEIARRGGLHRTVHAGESSGPEGVWDAVTLLHADRIDHGVRAIEDDRLVDHLAEKGIPLGVCPTSNLTLGVAHDLASHPVNRLIERGVVVTVNTDDPAPLGTRIEAEWAMCVEAFGWGVTDLARLAHASFTASFAPEELRAESATAIERTLSRLTSGARA